MDGEMELLNTTTVRITPEILSLIAEIDEFKGAWRAIGRIAPERLSGLRRVATIESVGSSTRIEGAPTHTEHTRRERGPFSTSHGTSLVSKTLLSFGLPPGTMIVSICSRPISRRG